MVEISADELPEKLCEILETVSVLSRIQFI
jgi:hypothetical protein